MINEINAINKCILICQFILIYVISFTKEKSHKNILYLTLKEINFESLSIYTPTLLFLRISTISFIPFHLSLYKIPEEYNVIINIQNIYN